MKHLADARHEHEHTHKTVDHRRDAGKQAHGCGHDTADARRGDLRQIHRRQKADRHAEHDRARGAVYTCENERQDAVGRLCRRGRPRLSEQERDEPDLPDGGDAGDDQVYADEQHAPDGDEAKEQEHAVHDRLQSLRFLFHIQHLCIYQRRPEEPAALRLPVTQATGTAPAAEMMDAASAEIAKSKNFCAVSLRAVPSFVTRTNGRCTR